MYDLHNNCGGGQEVEEGGSRVSGGEEEGFGQEAHSQHLSFFKKNPLFLLSTEIKWGVYSSRRSWGNRNGMNFGKFAHFF